MGEKVRGRGGEKAKREIGESKRVIGEGEKVRERGGGESKR